MGAGDIVLWVDDLETSYAIYCRICHEAEFESSQNLETPCACRGTVQFAHRDCIQRWCNEKGNTICEICLQNYEPGYSFSVSKKAQLLESMATGDGLALPARESLMEVRELNTHDEEEVECTDAADISASFCRSLALTLACLLLVRDLFMTYSEGVGDYPFSLFTVLILRASGVIVPMYFVMKVFGTIVDNFRRQHSQPSGRPFHNHRPHVRVENANHRL